jgi:hypothetical protein
MKINGINYVFAILFSVSLALVTSVSSWATTSVNVTPETAPADSAVSLTITTNTASAGGTVWIDFIGDPDGDGFVDPGEIKEISFYVTDGVAAPQIDGVTNINIKGDEDGSADSSITTTLKLHRSPFPVGCFIILVTDEDNSTATDTFAFTKAPTSQSVSGNVTCAGAGVAGAFVEVETTEGCIVGGAMTDSGGSYQIFLDSPGTYEVLIDDRQGYVNKERDSGAVEIVLSQDEHMAGVDLQLFLGNCHITGTIRDESTGQGIGGVEVEGEMENSDDDYWCWTLTDRDGSFDLPVIDGTWELEVLSLEEKGYVPIREAEEVFVSGANVTGQDASFPQVTALIYGTVKDWNGQPVSGEELARARADIDGLIYEPEVDADTEGNYVIGVIAGVWKVSVDLEDLCRDDLAEPPSESVTIADNETMELNFVCPEAGYIEGTVLDSNSDPIGDLWVSVFSDKCWQGYQGGADTDETGHYNIKISGGTYYIYACTGCDSEGDCPDYVSKWWNSSGGSMDCNDAEGVTVIAGHTTSGKDFDLEFGGGVSGTVTDSSDIPISGVWISSLADNACSGPYVSGGITDSNGNYQICQLPIGHYYYLRACPGGSGLDYADEWFDDKYDCNDADSVTINAGQVTEDIDFQLTGLCEGNFNGDRDVDGSDLAIFAADFGRTDCDTAPFCEGDFDGDNDVDGSDLAIFAADFGRTDCPPCLE